MTNPRQIDVKKICIHLSAPEKLLPRVAVEEFSALLELLPSCEDFRVLKAISESFPKHVSGLTPEVCLILSEIGFALLEHRPTIPKDVALLSKQLQVSWFRLQLSIGDDSCLEMVDELTLLRIMNGWSSDTLNSSFQLLLRCVQACDSRLRAIALEWLVPSVQHLALVPEEAFSCLVFLLNDADSKIRCDAIHLLSKCWLRHLSFSSTQNRDVLLKQALRDQSMDVSAAAIVTIAKLGLREWLFAFLLETDSVEIQSNILRVLGPFATAEDLPFVLGLVEKKPLGLGSSVRLFLLDAHKHGIFLHEEHLMMALQFYDLHQGWTAQEFVRVTHIIRSELIEQMALLPTSDRRWLRRAGLLAISVAGNATQLLVDCLKKVKDESIASALIEAAGQSSEYAEEELLLSWFEQLPEAVIPVLRVKGGRDSLERLKRLVKDPFCSSFLRQMAMKSLWALSPERTKLMEELSTELGPFASGLLDKERLLHQENQIIQLVVGHSWDTGLYDAIAPIEQLEILCESGDIRFLSQVNELFRAIFRSYVKLALLGDFTIKRLLLPALEQMIFRYGRKLISNGRSVRRWIEKEPETGRDLVLLFAYDWLKEEPADAICVGLLELAERHKPDGAILRFVESYWRHRHPGIKQAALKAILEAGEESRGLEVSICRLTETKEPRIVTQALVAVQRFESSWAESIVIQALERPEMAVKKEAASALSVMGSDLAVLAVVKWLSLHDNESFRSLLKNALSHTAGSTYTTVLIEALNDESDKRRKSLLWDALDGHISLQSILRLARRSSHEDLLEACTKGDVCLSDASSYDLAKHLHRVDSWPILAEDDPTQELRIKGFSSKAAERLVSECKPESYPKILAVVRAQIADWLSWVHSGSFGCRVKAIKLILDAADDNNSEHLELLLDCIEQNIEELEPVTIISFLERCVLNERAKRYAKIQSVEILRRLKPSSEVGGVRRFNLLGQLGGLHGAADLEMCLAECRVSPNIVLESQTLLMKAFSIPPQKHDESVTLTKIREEMNAWYQMDSELAAQWLTATLQVYPLGLSALPTASFLAKRKPFLSSEAGLADLLLALKEGTVSEREVAATRLLGWSDACKAWDFVRDAYLLGRIDLDSVGLQALVAQRLFSWPEDKRLWERAGHLVRKLTQPKQRAFIRGWIELWDEGVTEIADILQKVDQEQLIPFISARVLVGDNSLLWLFEQPTSFAARSLFEYLKEKAPEEIQHLLKNPPELTKEDENADDPVDPIAGKKADELVEVIKNGKNPKGLSVRGIHALAGYGRESIEPLVAFCLDKRPQVRSAALRSLRKVASKERTYESIVEVLKMETRRDVIVSLMASLGHGKYEPGLPPIFKNLLHKERRVREGAQSAIRAWGPDVVPTLRHHSRRARPDHRAMYTSLIDDIEQEDHK